MDFSFLWIQEMPIPPHAVAALLALIIGGVQLVLPKGTFNHRTLGYIWVILMSGVAVSAVFIHTIRLWGLFSPIHLLIPLVLFSLWRGVMAARRGDIKQHQKTMKYLYFLALVITGFFTLLPGRVMYQVMFGVAG